MRKIWRVLTAVLTALFTVAVCDCIGQNQGFGTSRGTSTSYSDYTTLIQQFVDGMKISSWEVCNIKQSGNLYLAGFKFNLSKGGTTLQLPYHGKSPSSYVAADNYICYNATFSYEVRQWQLWTRALGADQEINAIQFKNSSTTPVEIFNNNYLSGDVTGQPSSSQKNLLGSWVLIGALGTYSTAIDSITWIQWYSACSCSDTAFLPATLTNMGTSISVTATQTVPTLLTELEKFKQGTNCGGYSMTLLQSSGADCSSFLTLSGNTLVLLSNDPLMVGSYSIDLTATLTTKPMTQLKITFSVSFVNFEVSPTWVTSYTQVFGTPSTMITPLCVVTPAAGHTIVYTVSGAPAYVTVNANKSITLPSADADNQGKSFIATYQCEAQSGGVRVAGPLSFTANVLLQKQVILTVSPAMALTYNMTTGQPGQTVTPLCVPSTDYGYPITYSVTNQVSLPSYATVNPVTGEVSLQSNTVLKVNNTFSIDFSCQIPTHTEVATKSFTAAVTYYDPPPVIVPPTPPAPEPTPVIITETTVIVVPEIVQVKTPIMQTKYFIPTGSGPYLNDKYFDTTKTTTNFKLYLANTSEPPKSTLDWTYSYGNKIGSDPVSQILYNATSNELSVDISLGRALALLQYNIDENTIQIRTQSNGYTDPKMAGNYTVVIAIKNFLGQTLLTQVNLELMRPEPKLSSDDTKLFVDSSVLTLDQISCDQVGLITIRFTPASARKLQSSIDSFIAKNENLSLLQAELYLSSNQSRKTYDLSFTHKVTRIDTNLLLIQVNFACPGCISREGQDTMLVKLAMQGHTFFVQPARVPPQVTMKPVVVVTRIVVFVIMALCMALSLAINFCVGTCCRRNKKDTPKCTGVWQTWEVWQIVCYLHLQAAPTSGNALMFVKPMFKLVNVDFASQFPTVVYYWEKYICRQNENHAKLGPNFLALEIDSYFFFNNALSMVIFFAPVFFVMFLLSMSSIVIKRCGITCNQDDWHVFFKTVLQMNFGLAALLMLQEFPDLGVQTALSLLSVVLLLVVVPVYIVIRTCLLRKLPGRQIPSVFQRVATLVTIVFLREHWSVQVFTLYAIQLFALALQFPVFAFKGSQELPPYGAKPKKKLRWRSPDLSRNVSFVLVQTLIPLLVIFIHFDASGYGTMALSGFIFTFTSVKHLLVDDFVYTILLLRKRYLARANKNRIAPSEDQKLTDIEHLNEKKVSTNRIRKPWMKITAITEEESQVQSKEQTPKAQATLPSDTQANMIVSDSNEESAMEGDEWKDVRGGVHYGAQNPYSARKSLRLKSDAQAKAPAEGIYSSGEEMKQTHHQAHPSNHSKQPSVHRSRLSGQNPQATPKTIPNQSFLPRQEQSNNLIIQRDGRNLGDLNFKGPIQHISLNQNRELEIAFGTSPPKKGKGDKLYDSQPKTEVVTVPLGGFDSDDSIEVNIDIDWPKRETKDHFDFVGLPDPADSHAKPQVQSPTQSRNNAILNYLKNVQQKPQSILRQGPSAILKKSAVARSPNAEPNLNLRPNALIKARHKQRREGHDVDATNRSQTLMNSGTSIVSTDFQPKEDNTYVGMQALHAQERKRQQLRLKHQRQGQIKSPQSMRSQPDSGYKGNSD